MLSTTEKIKKLTQEDIAKALFILIEVYMLKKKKEKLILLSKKYLY